MEFVIIVLLVIGALFLLLRKLQTPDVPLALPRTQDSLARELRSRMESFLRSDCFSLVIQPVVDFRTNRVSGGEVLARLNHPERGVIFPDDFLPIVDELGLYPGFDRYIFRKCCVWLSRSLAQGEQLDCISCNFSRKTLCEKDIVADLVRIADAYGIPHSMLAVEITEQNREMDACQMQENLRQLKNAGFRIILDDFGSGVTSVQDLMQYPLDIVKIDRSILLKLQTEPDQGAFRSMVEMVTQLGAEVVCEGIETQEQSLLARQAGCHYGQGFLYFRGIGSDQVFEMIARSSILEDNL